MQSKHFSFKIYIKRYFKSKLFTFNVNNHIFTSCLIINFYVYGYKNKRYFERKGIDNERFV